MKKYDYHEIIAGQHLYDLACSERAIVFDDTRFEFQGKTVYVSETYGDYTNVDFAEDKTNRAIVEIDEDMDGVDENFDDWGYETDEYIYISQDDYAELQSEHMDAAYIAEFEPIEFTYNDEEFTYNHNNVVTHVATGTTYSE